MIRSGLAVPVRSEVSNTVTLGKMYRQGLLHPAGGYRPIRSTSYQSAKEHVISCVICTELDPMAFYFASWKEVDSGWMQIIVRLLDSTSDVAPNGEWLIHLLILSLLV